MKWILGLGIALLLALLIRYFYFKPSFGYGEECPIFESEGINGRTIKRGDFSNQYLILDFWGSWCAPCRVENEILVLFYEKYHAMKFKEANGLQILSVALESNREKALEAIQKDGLTWENHIIQTQLMESPMAVLFGVKEIPTKYLISPQGKILLINPDFKELDDYLAHQVLKN